MNWTPKKIQRLADALGFGLDGIYVALSDGSSFAANATKWTSAFDYNHGWRVDQHPRMFADVNGDGFLDIFHACLQFLLRYLVAGLTGVVYIKQRATDVVITNFERSDPHVRHVTICACNSGACVNSLAPELEFGMLGFDYVGARYSVGPIFKICFFVIRQDLIAF